MIFSVLCDHLFADLVPRSLSERFWAPFLQIFDEFWKNVQDFSWQKWGVQASIGEKTTSKVKQKQVLENRCNYVSQGVHDSPARRLLFLEYLPNLFKSFSFFLMEFTLQAPFGIIFLQKVLHSSVLCEENPPRIIFYSNFQPQYQLAGPFSWFSADKLPAGWFSANCFSSFWLPKVVYQALTARFRSVLENPRFSHRFLDLVWDVFVGGLLLHFGCVFSWFFNDFSITF